MIDTGIIGAGMTGVTCARALSDAGREVLVLDKGRGIGGRMATRRVSLDGSEARFDHGAQYIRAITPEFTAMLADLPEAAAVWDDGADRPHHVGLPGMSGLPRALAAGLDVRQGVEVTALTSGADGWRITTGGEDLTAARVVLTIPAPQIPALIGADHPLSEPLAGVTLDPCMTLMAAFPCTAPRPFVSRATPDHTLTWVAQDSTKPGRTDYVTTWVAQANRDWSLRHVDTAHDDIAARLLPHLCAEIGADPADALYVSAHRWRFAHVATALHLPFLSTDTGDLYIGGDWCLGPRVEAAWQSGTAIAADMWSATMRDEPRVMNFARLIGAALRPPPGAGRIALALGFGALCHLAFAAGVLAMIVAMFFGLSESVGRVPWPWAALANAALIVQFPLVHSLLLTGPGGRLLARLIPGPHGRTLATTTYALIASLQLLALFTLWTPSGIVWWRAEGAAFWAVCTAYAAAWLLLLKASFDAGAEVQSGALGWMSLLARIRPKFPDMPTRGLFRVIRQPIYVAFALTLWTVPVWTPDQLALAVSYTAYCLLAPRLKERRFAARYGQRFEQYRARVPYVLPARRPHDAQ